MSARTMANPLSRVLITIFALALAAAICDFSSLQREVEGEIRAEADRQIRDWLEDRIRQLEDLSAALIPVDFGHPAVDAIVSGAISAPQGVLQLANFTLGGGDEIDALEGGVNIALGSWLVAYGLALTGFFTAPLWVVPVLTIGIPVLAVTKYIVLPLFR